VQDLRARFLADLRFRKRFTAAPVVGKATVKVGR
jgi:hypothetical protein